MKLWSNNNNNFYINDISQSSNNLPKGVYSLEYDNARQCLYLKFIEQSFNFDFKVYGLETDFINRCKKTYDSTNTNMGVLLNGVKGTGKTITAKILANKLNLPIILIGTKHPEMSTFISSISQDLVIFIDEYEKIYSSGSFYENDEDDGITKKGGDSNLLALMDGAYKTAHRRFFILTTNNLWVNENLLNRPGRIRYKKNFADLNYIQINQIIEDFLEDKKWKDSIISFMKPLSIITVDIVKSIIEEINIHNEPPEVCCKDFNVENKEETYTVIKLQPNQEKTIAQNVPAKVVLRFIDKAVTDWQNNYLRTETLDLIMAEENTEPNIFTVRNLYGDNKPKYKIKFQKEMFIHKSLTI